MANRDILRKQLELVRFEKALDYIHLNARGAKHLNTQELATINGILTGKSDSHPWRSEVVDLPLPSGRREIFAVVVNPLIVARDLLSNCTQRARDGEIEEAATHLYRELVLHHFFQDANRRTAVAALYWLLLDRGLDIPAMGLLELGIGDIRNTDHLESLRTVIKATIAISQSRKGSPK